MQKGRGHGDDEAEDRCGDDGHGESSAFHGHASMLMDAGCMGQQRIIRRPE
jgi:hypothetical protein